MQKKSDNSKKETHVRGEILIETAEIIDGERNVDYGEPYDDFTTTAAFWQTYIERIVFRRGKIMIEAHDVAAMMMLLKTARLTWTADNKDHWKDAIGYAACGWECVNKEIEEYKIAAQERPKNTSKIQTKKEVTDMHKRWGLEALEIVLNEKK